MQHPQQGQAVLNTPPDKHASPRKAAAFLRDPYTPGILLFTLALLTALFTYKDYGVSWDENSQRELGRLTYDYITSGSLDLFSSIDRHYGSAFELPLIFLEKWLNLTDTRDILLMRHFVTHLFFLISALCMYMLASRLFKNKFIASLAFVMLVFAPRLYAHSFFNTKDIPFLSMVPIVFLFCHRAFEHNWKFAFLLLGMLCGYTTGIRIMGIMLVAFVIFFLAIDLALAAVKKEKTVTTSLNLAIFLGSFCATLYLVWPWLWPQPINNFLESLSSFSRYSWDGFVLVNGKYLSSLTLPWFYFPVWFLVSLPEVWLLAGCAGMVLIIIDFFRSPLAWFGNKDKRTFLLYLLCFFTPVLAVIILHSVIYNDWRHLYFVYPPFVLIALYFIHKMLQTRYRYIVGGACILQLTLIGYFMIRYHPFQHIYFNYLASHEKDALRKNYDTDYWGCTYRQGLERLLVTDNSSVIKINCDYKQLLINNVMMLPPADRERITIPDKENADYFIQDWRGPLRLGLDYTFIQSDSISVLNSTVFALFRKEKDPAALSKRRAQEYIRLNHSLALNQNDTDAHAQLSMLYLMDANYDAAEVHLKNLVRLTPNDKYAINELSGIYFRRKDYAKTKELCEKAILMDPRFLTPYVNLAACYLNSGKYDSGISYLNTAINTDPRDPRPYHLLVIAYKAMGRPDSAKKYEDVYMQHTQ